MAGANVNDHMAVGPDDHRAYIVIVAVVGLSWSVLVLLIRLFIRIRLTGPFGSDDTAAALATFVATCQTAVTLYAVREGLGVRYNDYYDDKTSAGLKAYYASNIMYIVAICPAKASMALLISRVSRKTADRHLLATRIVIGLIFVWGISSIFIAAFQCGTSRPWDITGHTRCTGVYARWLVVEVLSVVLELLISGLAFTLVLGLDMALRTKFIVVTAFSAQLFVAIPVGFRLFFLREAARGGEGPVMFTLANLTIATQVVMHFSVMAATFPCFRQFLQAFNNDLCATTKMGAADGSGGRNRSGADNSNSSYAMSALRPRGAGGGAGAGEGSAHTTRLNHDSDTEAEPVTRPFPLSREGTATPPDDGRSLQSMGSERAFIKQKQRRA